MKSTSEEEKKMSRNICNYKQVSMIKYEQTTEREKEGTRQWHFVLYEPLREKSSVLKN